MFFDNILPVQHGAKTTIVDVMTYSAWKHRGESKVDTMFIVYKDKDDIKRVKMIPDPSVGIFFTKPECRNEWRTVRKYIPIEKVYPEVLKPRQILGRIHKELTECNDPRSRELLKIYETASRSGDWKAKKEILKSQHAFMSDITAEEFYRIMLSYHYDCNQYHVVNKAFLDIESDIYGLTTSQTDANLDPTNAVTMILDYDKSSTLFKRPQVFTLLLRNHKRYPQQAEFEKNLKRFIEQCHAEFDEYKIVKKGKTTIMDCKADYHIKLFDDERDLQITIFKILNTYRPDVCNIWNISYDLPKLRGRQENLGLNHVKIMCDPNFPQDSQFVEMNIDRRASVDIADRKTYIKMASTIRYNDQMQTYANIRKGQKSYGKNTLDNIAFIEAGIGKRKFRKGVDVTNAAIMDYWNFVLYNINDVWAQVIIDRITNDTFTLMMDSNQHQCAFENLTKQTKYQKQIYYTEYLRRGFVPGNNKNNDYISGYTEDYADMIREAEKAKKLRKLIDSQTISEDDIDDIDDFIDYEIPDEDYEDEETQELMSMIESDFEDSIDRKLKLKGGLVGNPNNNSPNGEELIPGIKSKHVYKEVVDMDYASEYPWAKFTRSISESTQWGRLIIPKKISDRQNIYGMKNYLPGAEFVSDYISQDVISLGVGWFNLPGVTTAIKELESYF